MNITLILILTSVTLSAVGQLLLKVGMSQVGTFAFNTSNILPISLRIFTNLPVIGGVMVYGISLIIWLMILSRTEVSFAYPMISLGYIINAIAAYYLLGEDLSAMRISGIIVIILGVILISRS